MEESSKEYLLKNISGITKNDIQLLTPFNNVFYIDNRKLAEAAVRL